MSVVNKLKQFKIFQHTFKEPSPFYSHQIVTPNSVAKWCGLDVFSPEYKIQTRALLVTLILQMLYWYATLTSVYDLRHEREELINCMATVGLGILVIVKTVTFVVFRKDLLWLHNYTKTLYREECNPRTKNMLMDNIFLLSVILKTMLIGYALTSFCLDFAPFLVLAKTGEKMLPFGFYLPYLDQNSWFGYIINYLLQIALTISVSSGDMGPDCVYMIISMNTFSQIDLLIDALRVLNENIQSGQDNLDQCLEQIIKRHQEHLR